MFQGDPRVCERCGGEGVKQGHAGLRASACSAAPCVPPQGILTPTSPGGSQLKVGCLAGFRMESSSWGPQVEEPILGTEKGRCGQRLAGLELVQGSEATWVGTDSSWGGSCCQLRSQEDQPDRPHQASKW